MNRSFKRKVKIIVYRKVYQEKKRKENYGISKV